jgi:hypothetical protein
MVCYLFLIVEAVRYSEMNVKLYQTTRRHIPDDLLFTVTAVRTSNRTDATENSVHSRHLDVVRGPSTPHDPESDAGGSLSSWQGHPSR